MAKPKLVARASPAETSPWKTNKNAPKISLGEVPELLRPLFSFTLWRIYEHVTLNDSNQTVLLSNEPLVYRAAQNLNITVMRIEELRCIVNSNKMVDLDCDVYGDLEREFGPRTSKALHQKRPNIDVGIEDVASQDYEYIDRNKELVMSANGNHITTENSSDNSMSLTASDSGKHLFEHKQNDDILGMQQEVLSDIHDEQKNVQKSVEESILKVNGECEKSIDSKQVFSKESTPTVMEEAKLATVERPAITYQDNKEFDDKNSIFTTKNLAGNISTKVENDLAKRPITKTNGILKRNESVIDNGYIALEKKDAVVSDNRSDLSQPLSYSRSATLDNSSPSSRRSSDVSNPTLTKPAQDLEDSDEEVVVFNPRAKRLSAQKKTSNQGRKILAPPQKISSETSPSETISKVISSEATSPKIFSMTTSPKLASNQTASSKTTYPDTSPKMTSPKLVSPKKASPNTSSTSPNLGSSKLTAPKNAVAKINNGRSNHPRNSRPRTPVAPAAIIDPDFFGRSSVVSIRPNASNGYARHSPRGSPRRGPRNVDSEVDYVLTSGATREATRGKGKLWVP